MVIVCGRPMPASTVVRLRRSTRQSTLCAASGRAAQVELAGGGGTDMGSGIYAAAALRPRPSVVIVLTDGFTPWPEAPPPAVRIIVGVLCDGGRPRGWTPPAWARTVWIEDAPGEG